MDARTGTAPNRQVSRSERSRVLHFPCQEAVPCQIVTAAVLLRRKFCEISIVALLDLFSYFNDNPDIMSWIVVHWRADRDRFGELSNNLPISF